MKMSKENKTIDQLTIAKRIAKEKFNIDIVKTLIDVFNKATGNNIQYEDAIEHIADPRGGGHDLRYAIDATKILKELGWQPKETFDSGIEKTVRWYLDNEKWLENIVNGSYKDYYKEFYKEN